MYPVQYNRSNFLYKTIVLNDVCLYQYCKLIELVMRLFCLISDIEINGTKFALSSRSFKKLCIANNIPMAKVKRLRVFRTLPNVDNLTVSQLNTELRKLYSDLNKENRIFRFSNTIEISKRFDQLSKVFARMNKMESRSIQGGIDRELHELQLVPIQYIFLLKQLALTLCTLQPTHPFREKYLNEYQELLGLLFWNEDFPIDAKKYDLDDLLPEDHPIRTMYATENIRKCDAIMKNLANFGFYFNHFHNCLGLIPAVKYLTYITTIEKPRYFEDIDSVRRRFYQNAGLLV